MGPGGGADAGDASGGEGVGDDVIGRLGSEAVPTSELSAATALEQKASALSRLGRIEEAIAAYGEVTERVGDSADPGLRSFVWLAYNERAKLLVIAGRNAEAIAASDALLGEIGSSPETEHDAFVVRALEAKAIALGNEERYREAIQVLDTLVERFGGRAEPQLRRQVAMAWHKKVGLLLKLGLVEDATRASGDLLTRYAPDLIDEFAEIARRSANATQPSARRERAGALLSKAGLLEGLGREHEAVAVFDDLIADHAEDGDREVQDLVAIAREGRERLLAGQSER